MKTSRWFASPLLGLLLSPLCARADESFEDTAAARALFEAADKVHGEARAIRVSLQGTPLTFVPLGAQRLVLFRRRQATPTSAPPAVPQCYDGVRVSVRDHKTVNVGEPLGEIHFCQQSAVDDVAAEAYPSMDRIVIRLPDHHPRAGISVAWTHLLSFEASTGKKIAAADVETGVSAVFPTGAGFFYVPSNTSSSLRAWPPDERFPADVEDGWSVVMGPRGGAGLGDQAPYLFLQGPEKKLAIIDLRSKALWSFDRTFGGAIADSSWSSLGPVRTASGYAMMLSANGAQQLYALTLTPGATPRLLGTIHGPTNRFTADGDSLFITSGQRTAWEAVLDLMRKRDDRVDEALTHVSDPDADIELMPVAGQVPWFPSEVWETTADAQGRTPLSTQCHRLPPGWRPMVPDGGTAPESVANDPAAGPCSDDWQIALARIAKVKQAPLERAQTPAAAAGFCINALVRQRASELLRCVDLEQMIAAQGGREAAMISALISTVSHDSKLDESQLDALAMEACAGPLADATREVRAELVQYLATHETIPAAKLGHVTAKGFTAQWRFETEHPFTLVMGFGYSRVGKRKRLPWVLTDTRYIDEHGKVFPGLVDGKLPTRSAY